MAYMVDGCDSAAKLVQVVRTPMATLPVEQAMIQVVRIPDLRIRGESVAGPTRPTSGQTWPRGVK